MGQLLLSRRRLIQGIGAASVLAPFARAYAAAPIKELELIVGFAPGGGTDRSARVIGPAWAKAMGLQSPVMYTYAPGAGTVIAHRQLLNGRKDGSLVHAIPAPYTAWNIALQQGGYSLDDFAWVGGYFDDPNVLLVKKDSKYSSIDQFIEDAKKEEKTVAVSAPMSASHAATVVLRELTGAKLKVISFNGGAESRNAVAGGHVDACMAPYWSATNVVDLTKAIGIFADKNPAPQLWTPVPVNQVLNVKIPDLVEPYAMQMSAAAASKVPDTYKQLVSSLETAVKSDEAKQAASQAQHLDLFMTYRNPESCKKFIQDYLTLLTEFKKPMERDLDQM
jgi:putative tricarboxylic transport membrane protein